MHFKTLILATAMALAPAAASAATLVNDAGTRLVSIADTDPIGQSFLAQGTALQSIGLQFSTLNPTNPASAITVKLLQGAGLGGSVLGSKVFTPATLPGRDDPKQWTDFDFSGITLTLGAAYTISVESAGSSYRNAIYFGPNLINPPYGNTFTPDSYTDGKMFFSGGTSGCGTNPASCDLNFRVTTAESAVPEPATWAMMITGFGLVGGLSRSARRKRILALGA